MNIEWNTIKRDEELIQKQIEKYSTKQKLDSSKNTLLIWMNKSNINSCMQPDVITLDGCTLSSIPATTTTTYTIPTTNAITTAHTSTTNNIKTTDITTTIDTPATINAIKRIPCVAQEKLSNELDGINERITTLVQLKQTGLFTTENETQLKILFRQKGSTSSQLKRLRNNANAQKRLRVKRKNKLQAISEAHPDVGLILRTTFRQDKGRSSIDDTCPDLLSTIEEIAILGGAVDDRRRTAIVRSCLTLDDLRETLKVKGYEIKRSTLYYR